jgi:hypothetical protein
VCPQTVKAAAIEVDTTASELMEEAANHWPERWKKKK